MRKEELIEVFNLAKVFFFVVVMQKLGKRIIESLKENDIRTIIVLLIALFIYWIVLIFVYEIDRKIPVSNIDEKDLVEKYNPILAGCFEGGRDVLPRDIIAIILNLINKKFVKLEIRGNLRGKDNYKYFIRKNPKAKNKMDKIEKYVCDWIFESKTNIGWMEEEIDLIERLKLLPRQEKTAEKFKLLNIIVKKELNKKGINKNKVPDILKTVNTMILILSIMTVIIHFNMMGFFPDLQANKKLDLLNRVSGGTTTTIGIIVLITIIAIITVLSIGLFFKIRQKVSGAIHKITEKKIATTVLATIMVFIILIVIIRLIRNRV